MKINGLGRLSGIAVFAFLFSILMASAAMANLEVVKAYKATFEGEKPKCSTCHVDKVPKKEDGKHEWNDYGKKVKAIKEKPDEATYQAAGKSTAEDAQ